MIEWGVDARHFDGFLQLYDVALRSAGMVWNGQFVDGRRALAGAERIFEIIRHALPEAYQDPMPCRCRIIEGRVTFNEASHLDTTKQARASRN